MNDVEEQILSYPHLPVEEQREIEAYVESNPEWAPLLRDVRSIEHLSANAQADLPSDALLATYVAVQHFHPDEVSPELQAAFSNLEARIENDEALRREVDAAHRRLKEAEATIDPVSHFETLTGHQLDEEAEQGRAEATEQTSGEARQSIASVLEVFVNLPLLVRGGAAIAVLLVGLYGGLYGVSRATQSTLDRLAVVEVSDQVVENYANAEMRSAVPEPDTVLRTVDDRYLDALSVLRGARISTLGLFPRYDTDALARAEEQLDHVLEQVQPGSFLALEAHFYLGKIALAQGEVNAARGHFKTVVKREGRRADEAYEILKALQQERDAGSE